MGAVQRCIAILIDWNSPVGVGRPVDRNRSRGHGFELGVDVDMTRAEESLVPFRNDIVDSLASLGVVIFQDIPGSSIFLVVPLLVSSLVWHGQEIVDEGGPVEAGNISSYVSFYGEREEKVIPSRFGSESDVVLD